MAAVDVLPDIEAGPSAGGFMATIWVAAVWLIEDPEAGPELPTKWYW
jgi:hypothetical protein